MPYFPVFFKIDGAVEIGIDRHAVGIVQINPFEILAAGVAVGAVSVRDLEELFIRLDREKAGNLMKEHAVVIGESSLFPCFSITAYSLSLVDTD